MKKSVLFTALILLGVSGFMLHYRIHYFLEPDKLHPGIYIFDRTEFLANLFPLIDVVLVTALYCSRKTAVYGYLLNGLLVIYGTIFMAHFSLAEMAAKNLPLSSLIFKSTLPDIGILWSDFLVGKALFDLYTRPVSQPAY